MKEKGIGKFVGNYMYALVAIIWPDICCGGRECPMQEGYILGSL